MAYNNVFPVTYPQYYQPYQQTPISASQTPQIQPQGTFTNGTNSIIWVQGEAGAKSYLIAPNTTVQLWDSEEQVIYLKSADASGMPSMKVLDYKIRENVPQPQNPTAPEAKSDYVTKDEFSEVKNKLHEVEERLKKQFERYPNDRSKKEVKEDA